MATAVHAEIVTFEFKGRVTQDTHLGKVGDLVTGRFSWDTAIAPWYHWDKPDYSYYAMPANFSWTTTIGAHRMTSQRVVADVYNNTGGPNTEDFIVFGAKDVLLDGVDFPGASISCQLAGGPSSPDVFLTSALPSKLVVSKFDSVNLNGCVMTLNLDPISVVYDLYFQLQVVNNPGAK